MKRSILIFALGAMLPLSIFAQSGDPEYWKDPYDTGDGSGDPEMWADPMYTDPITAVTLPETGMPANFSWLVEHQNELEVTVERTIVGGMYNTLCLPFDVPSLEGTPLASAQVVEFTNAVMEGGLLKVYFDYVDEIKAGVPYLVYNAETITSPMVFYNIVLTAQVGASIEGELINFVGILEPYAMPNTETQMFLGSNNTLFYSNGGGSMKGMRAYFELKGTNAPARLCIGRGLSTIITEQIPFVESVENKKIIINNTLVISKGGVLYDVLGKKL